MTLSWRVGWQTSAFLHLLKHLLKTRWEDMRSFEAGVLAVAEWIQEHVVRCWSHFTDTGTERPSSLLYCGLPHLLSPPSSGQWPGNWSQCTISMMSQFLKSAPQGKRRLSRRATSKDAQDYPWRKLIKCHWQKRAVTHSHFVKWLLHPLFLKGLRWEEWREDVRTENENQDTHCPGSGRWVTNPA